MTTTITLRHVVVDTPSSLTDGMDSDKYEEYEFTVSSRTKSSGYRELDHVERDDR